MVNNKTLITEKDKLLFTPGPLTTSSEVKKAMLRDLGSRDLEFVETIKEIRNSLLELGNSVKGEYEAIIMQGSGTFGIEAVISSTIPVNGKLLIIINGAYGTRINKIADKLKLETVKIVYEENEPPRLEDISNILLEDNSITHIAVVHCETTTGIFNPIKEIGEIAARYNKKYIVDAMSSYGAVPVDLKQNNIDYLVSSSNKCIEGVPGFSFVLAKLLSLKEIKDFSRSVSLDLYEQWQGLEKNGQFRFTPPTHALLAFNKALSELKEEGGVSARAERYKKNYEVLIQNMRKIGFKEYLSPSLQGYIITSFHYPEHPNFNFEEFYRILNSKGFVIYPGKLTEVDCFRIGNIGKIYEEDILNLISAISETLKEMDVNIK